MHLKEQIYFSSQNFADTDSKAEAELILVYNADRGFFNIIKDSLHKAISPSTYKCNLCALTYGTVSMKEEWLRFIERLEIPAELMHRDEFYKMLKTHPHSVKDVKFPTVFLRREDEVNLFISHIEINSAER